jgi:hypothetical protein
MSKILNRPMFRGGGKVSSYGNGIASGLADGYEKGGSVQDRPGYFYGGQILKGLGGAAMKYGLRPAAKYGMKGMDYLFNPSKEGLKKYMSSPLGNTKDYLSAVGTSRAGQGIKSLANKLNPFNDPLVKYPLKYGVGAPISFAGKTIKNSPFGVAAAGAANYIDVIPGEGSSEGYLGKGKDYFTELYDNVFTGNNKKDEDVENLDDPNSEENKLKRIKKAQEDSKKEIDEIKKLYGTEKKVDSEDQTLGKIAKKKAIIEKAMGGGKKAMIDDLSTMGLSFAGKALKEGATTKSAFADFFEEESKRPSRSKKLSDAASQAAIQSYLTGEIDEKKFNEKMNMFIGQTKINSLMKKAEKENLSLAEIGQSNRTSGSQSKKDEQNAQVWLDINEPGKFVNTTNSKKIPVEVLFTDENIGQFFLDENTGEFFEIVVLNDGAIGKQRKG